MHSGVYVLLLVLLQGVWCEEVEIAFSNMYSNRSTTSCRVPSPNPEDYSKVSISPTLAGLPYSGCEFKFNFSRKEIEIRPIFCEDCIVQRRVPYPVKETTLIFYQSYGEVNSCYAEYISPLST